MINPLIIIIVTDRDVDDAAEVIVSTEQQLRMQHMVNKL